MTNIEAMKLALDALNYGLHVGFDESSESQIKKCTKAFQQSSNAIAALRQAISEAEQAEKQEPVAWHHPKCNGQCIACLIEINKIYESH